MRFLLLTLLCTPLVAGATSTESAALKRLYSIAKEIRERAYEADATVARAKGESKEILAKAEAEAAKIKAEADEYVKKVEKEIQEIQRKMAGKEDPPGAPNRSELSASLQSTVEPIISCFSHKDKNKRAACTLQKLQAALDPYFKS